MDQLGHGGFWRRSKHAVGRLLMTRSDSGQETTQLLRTWRCDGRGGHFDIPLSPGKRAGFADVESVWGSQMEWDAVT